MIFSYGITFISHPSEKGLISLESLRSKSFSYGLYGSQFLPILLLETPPDVNIGFELAGMEIINKSLFSKEKTLKLLLF